MNHEELQSIIKRYERYLRQGQYNLVELEGKKLDETTEYLIQKVLISVWRMVIKDFRSLSDKKDNEA